MLRYRRMIYAAAHRPHTAHSCSNMREAITARGSASSRIASSRDRLLAHCLAASGVSSIAASRAAATMPSATMSIVGGSAQGSAKATASTLRGHKSQALTNTGTCKPPADQQWRERNVRCQAARWACRSARNDFSTVSAATWGQSPAASGFSPASKAAMCSRRSAANTSRRVCDSPDSQADLRVVATISAEVGSDMRGVYVASAGFDHGTKVAARHSRRAPGVNYHNNTSTQGIAA